MRVIYLQPTQVGVVATMSPQQHNRAHFHADNVVKAMTSSKQKDQREVCIT